jgi:hypothetical protein
MLVSSSTNNNAVVITNTDFLSELAQAAPQDSCLWVNRFHGNPNSDEAKWGGLVYTPTDHDRSMCDSWGEYNTYFSVAAVKKGADGMFHRRKATFARMLALVVDDVDLDSLYSPPSWVLETSPGKTQAGYLLDAEDPDCANEELCSAVVKSMTMRGFIGGDISGNNAVRYVRLPTGTNQKPRVTGHFQHRILSWKPEIRLSLEDACGAVGMDLDSVRNAAVAASAGVAPMPTSFGGSQEEKLEAAVAAVMQGHFHEPLNVIAASMISTGAHPAAVTNMLRGLMQGYPGQKDDRWEQRYKDIPRCVRGAEEKFKPAPAPAPLIDPETGEVLPLEPERPLFTKVSKLLSDIKPVQWLIENYLETDALSMVFGPSGGGKSFCVVDMACCVATGTSWHGMPVKQGAVFYIAGEGHNGLARRFAAWQKARNVKIIDDTPLFKSNRAVMMLDAGAAQGLAAEVERLVKETGHTPQMVVVDTLARNFGDGDENKQQDANMFIEHLDEYIRRKWQCNVMTVHHSGHDMDRARGSSALKGAMDQEIWVKGQAGHIELKVTKMKDAEVPADRRFKITQVGLGIEDDCGIEINGAHLEIDGNPLEFKVGMRANGMDLTALDVAKAMYPKWPGVPPMSVALGCSERSLSRIMKAMRDGGMATGGKGGWSLTDEAINHLSMTGFLILGGE